MYINAHGVSSGGGATEFGAHTSPSSKQDTAISNIMQFRSNFPHTSAEKVVEALGQHMKNINRLDCKLLCCQAAATTSMGEGKNLQIRFLESAQKLWKPKVLSVTAHKPTVFFDRLGGSALRPDTLRVSLQESEGAKGPKKTGVRPGTSTIAYLHGEKTIKLDLHAQSCPQAIANFTDHMRGKLYKVQDKATRHKLQQVLKAPHQTVIELADALNQVANESNCTNTKSIMAEAKELALLKGKEQQQGVIQSVKKEVKGILSRVVGSNPPAQSKSEEHKEHKVYLEAMYKEKDFLKERQHWVEEKLSHRNMFKHLAFQCTGIGSNPEVTALLKNYQSELNKIEPAGGNISEQLLKLDAKLLQALQEVATPQSTTLRQLTMQLELDELPDDDREKFLQKLAEGAPELVTQKAASADVDKPNPTSTQQPRPK